MYWLAELLIAAIIFCGLWYLTRFAPSPLDQILKVVLGIIGAVWLILLLVGMMGGGIPWHHVG